MFLHKLISIQDGEKTQKEKGKYKLTILSGNKAAAVNLSINKVNDEINRIKINQISTVFFTSHH